MKRKLKIIKVILGVALLIGLISFTTIHNASRTVNKLDVAFVQPVDNYFINEESIRDLINRDDTDILKQKLRQVDVKKVEDLLKTHIIAIQKVGQRSYNLIVNTGNYYIELGTLNNFEQKIHNLKLFYSQYIDFIGTEDYEKLSLKFVNQVVATKRIKNGKQ